MDTHYQPYVILTRGFLHFHLDKYQEDSSECMAAQMRRRVVRTIVSELALYSRRARTVTYTTTARRGQLSTTQLPPAQHPVTVIVLATDMSPISSATISDKGIPAGTGISQERASSRMTYANGSSN